MTHWKQNFNYAYTGAYELAPGEERTLTISKTTREEVVNQQGGKETCFVAYFSESNKPMVLNKTNCKTISKLYGPFVENWIGKRITIKSETVKAFGETVDALRVRNTKPAEVNPVDCSAQIKQMNDCKSIEELQSKFLALDKESQKATAKIVQELKTKLTPAAQ